MSRIVRLDDKVEKQNPRKGTETDCLFVVFHLVFLPVEKQNPRKGTETSSIVPFTSGALGVEKQNPRKGTETP